MTQPNRCPSVAPRLFAGHVVLKKPLLTDRLGALKPAPAGKRITLWDAGLSGFGVRVTDRGVISFHVMRRLPASRTRPRGAGPVSVAEPAAARKQAGAALADLASGVHPRERAHALRVSEDQRKAVTVAHVVEEFIESAPVPEAHRPCRRAIAPASNWSAGGGDGRSPTSPAPTSSAWSRPSATPAPRRRGRPGFTQSRLFGWALSRGTYGLTASPCDRVRIADLIAAPKARERVLDTGELRAIWQVTGRRRIPVRSVRPAAAPAGLPPRRTGRYEARRTRPRRSVFGSCPATGRRMSSRARFPLSRQAVAILASLPAFPGPYIFSTVSGARPISGFTKFKQRLDRRLGAAVPANWTLHDIRRTMRTHLSALPISGTVAELMIGHKQRGVRAVYDRFAYLDEQRSGFRVVGRAPAGHRRAAAGERGAAPGGRALTADGYDPLYDRLEQILSARAAGDRERRDTVKAAARILYSLSRWSPPGEVVNPTTTKQADQTCRTVRSAGADAECAGC